MNILQHILAGILTLGGLLFPSHTTPQIKVGAAPQFVAGQTYYLYGGGVGSTDTSIKLTSFTQGPNKTPLATADLVGGVSDEFWGTIEPASNRKELVGCTGVTQNADNTAVLTGCVRGLLFITPYTATTSNQLSHSGGSTFVLSDSPQLYNAILTYVNNSTASSSGVNNASLIAKGIVQLSTGAQAASHTGIGGGSTDAPLALYSGIASSTRSANTAQVVISSSTDGYIDSSYLNITTTSLGVALQSTTTTYTATTTFTWTKPSGAKVIYIAMIGGGGGGGGTNSGLYGGGGGGGAVVQTILVASTTSATTTITVGAGGAAGGANNSGGDGGNSSFGTYIIAHGGGGGGPDAGNGGNGGLFNTGGGAAVIGNNGGTVGTFGGGGGSSPTAGYSGGNGSNGNALTAAGGGGGGYAGSTGGSQIAGTPSAGLVIGGVGGGNPGASGNPSTGVAGGLYGGGGGGGAANGLGGKGADGIVQITTFF